MCVCVCCVRVCVVCVCCVRACVCGAGKFPQSKVVKLVQYAHGLHQSIGGLLEGQSHHSCKPSFSIVHYRPLAVGVVMTCSGRHVGVHKCIVVIERKHFFHIAVHERSQRL